MKIMVTGGAGFIGSNVVDGYIKEGHAVSIVDNLFTGKVENINPKAEFCNMDIRSEDMEVLMKRIRPDVLNHHAAQMSVPASVANPLLDADINIRGLLNLLENAIKYDVRKVIFISSGGAIYGDASQYPTSEDYSPQPLSPYAISKLVSEYYIRYYGHQYGLDYTILRYGNIYGPRQIPHGEAGVVAIFMKNLLDAKPSTLYHFPEDRDGMIRDYCYVGDVVRANLRSLEDGGNEVFNIGTGNGTKTLDLYRTIHNAIRTAGMEMPEELLTPEREPARPGDIPRSCLIVEKAQHLLAWSSEIDLEEGIRATLQWPGG